MLYLKYILKPNRQTSNTKKTLDFKIDSWIREDLGATERIKSIFVGERHGFVNKFLKLNSYIYYFQILQAKISMLNVIL